MGDGQAVDAEEVAYAGGDKVGPAEVDDAGEGEVRPEVVVLELGAYRREPEPREVTQDGAADEGYEHDGPVGEGLAGQVGEDHLGRHAAEDEGHGQAEEDQVVLAHQRRVRRVQPGADAEGVHGHGDPLEEDGEDGEAVPPPRLDDVEHAEGHVAEQERAGDHGDPDVADRVAAHEVVVAEQAVLADDVDDALRPDAGPANARDGHDAARDEDALGGAVDVAQV